MYLWNYKISANHVLEDSSRNYQENIHLAKPAWFEDTLYDCSNNYGLNATLLHMLWLTCEDARRKRRWNL